MIPIDKQPHCSIEYIPNLHCVVQTWRGFAGSQKFRQSIQKTIEYFQTHPEVRYIISDTRQQEMVAREDTEWLATQANPQLVEAGLRKLAFIAPQSLLTKMAEERYAYLSEGLPEIRWFADFEQAKAWIGER
jgi:hypothetical protein